MFRFTRGASRATLVHMVVSQGELARRIGVSAMAVSKAVKAGKLDRLPDGIDLKAQKTVDYIATAKHQRRTGKKQRRRAGGKSKAKIKQKPPRSTRRRGKVRRRSRNEEHVGGELELNGETYNEADLRDKIAAANLKEQKLAQDRGELVERKDIKLVFAHVYTILGSQVKTLHEKVGPDVAAAFGLTEEKIQRVQEIMSVDELRALSQIKKEFNAYLDSIGESLIE